MAKITYELSAAQAIALTENLAYLRKVELINPGIAEEGAYTPDEISALMAFLEGQHAQIDLIQMLVEEGDGEE